MQQLAARFLFLILLLGKTLLSQPTFTADDLVPPYSGPFRAGVNPGAHPPFTDFQLADLSAGNPALSVDGVGCTAWRPGLFEHFLEDYGYDARAAEFDHAYSLGLRENTVIVGFPSEAHRDHTQFCPGVESTLFSNLYEPIWDGGANGTPVNEQNHFALYLWKAAQQYKKHVRFWEIWNEPGFDYTFLKGYLLPGQPGNWWENNPDPCDYKLRAPIHQYIRTLRIAYEVLKTADPDAYVLCGGVGYPSFLDAILRNTDNPADGSVTPDFPKKGGAYFDVLGFHAYPHFDASTQQFNDVTQQFDYFRHSDGAADGIGVVKKRFEKVLTDRGYDGTTHPKKLWTITESNIPRKPFAFPLGSAEAQRNYVIKAWVECLREGFLQNHVYAFSEEAEFDKATSEFDLMGLYKKLDFNDLYHQRVNDEGVALRSANLILFGKKFDAARTASLNLPPSVGGAAVKDDAGNFTYVLWAKTKTDLSEAATAFFTFPNGLVAGELLRREWDFSRSQITQTASPLGPIQLTAAPVFFSEKSLSLSKYAGCAPLTVQFSDQSGVPSATTNWTFSGGSPASSTASAGSTTFSQSGTYEVLLEKKNTAGQVVFSKKEVVAVGEKPTAAFSATEAGAVLFLKNSASSNTQNFDWNFGDGTASDDPNPVHVFYQSGNFSVKLTASNLCGNSTQSIDYQIVAPSLTMLAQTADESVPPNDHPFRPGVISRYAPGWSDEQQADIAAGNFLKNVEGAGVKTLKVPLPQDFVETFGYDIRLATFQHYLNLDLQENTAVLGFPSPLDVETWPFCATDKPVIFKDLYREIWDGGLNGTPVNELNPFANYVWNVVNTYKNQVRFWQVYDGVDTDFSGKHGWLPPGEPGNWWDNDPEPCDMSLHAPAQYYIRMLRIAYEIVHATDPDGLVLVGGIGFPSFLDVVLRNTDNPGNLPTDGGPATNPPGSVQPGYLKKGGAFFDAIGFNEYPFVDGSTKYYDTNIGHFVYKRHSDAAADGILLQKKRFDDVLKNRGYDGSAHPQKIWLVSETGVARQVFQDYFGGPEAQRNWLLKAWIAAQKEGFAQMSVFDLSEAKEPGTADFASDLMGLYETIQSKQPYDAEKTDLGTAYQTASLLLFKQSFDAQKTASLNLPAGVRGAAFKDVFGKFTFALWAETSVDNSEVSAANFQFPTGSVGPNLTRFEWDFSKTKTTASQPTAAPIALTAVPIFLSENTSPLAQPLALFSADTTEGCAGLVVKFHDQSLNSTGRNWSFPGGNPASSSDLNPAVTYSTTGSYAVSLTASSPLGEHQKKELDFIQINPPPVAGFDIKLVGAQADFTNTSSPDADFIKWIFWDGAVEFGFTPSRFFISNGDYPLTLVAFNECGSDTLTKIISIHLAPVAGFNVLLPGACNQFSVGMQDASFSSPDGWLWSFPGGSPASSIEQFPTVAYPGPGTYTATLVVQNQFGADTISKTFSLTNAVYNQLKPTVCAGGKFEVAGHIFDKNKPSGEVVLPGASVAGCDSIIVVELKFEQPPVTNLAVTIFSGQSYLFDNQQLTASGIYFDTVKTAVGCDSVLILTLDVLVKTGEPGAAASTMKISPNPAAGDAVLEWAAAGGGEALVESFSLDGRKIFEEKASAAAGQNFMKMPASNWPPGIYRIRLTDAGGSRWASFVRI